MQTTWKQWRKSIRTRAFSKVAAYSNCSAQSERSKQRSQPSRPSQPPTEAQAELAARASTSSDFTGMIRVDGTMTREQALAAVMRMAQGEDSARLDWLSNCVMEHGRISAKRDRDSFVDSPTFGDLPTVTLFTVPNQYVQGEGLRAAIDRARASAETGGVKS